MTIPTVNISLTRTNEFGPLTRPTEFEHLTRPTEFSKENEKGHVPDDPDPDSSSSDSSSKKKKRDKKKNCRKQRKDYLSDPLLSDDHGFFNDSYFRRK